MEEDVAGICRTSDSGDIIRPGSGDVLPVLAEAQQGDWRIGIQTRLREHDGSDRTGAEIAVIGDGIVGMSAALALAERPSGLCTRVLDKELRPAQHLGTDQFGGPIDAQNLARKYRRTGA